MKANITFFGNPSDSMRGTLKALYGMLVLLPWAVYQFPNVNLLSQLNIAFLLSCMVGVTNTETALQSTVLGLLMGSVLIGFYIIAIQGKLNTLVLGVSAVAIASLISHSLSKLVNDDMVSNTDPDSWHPAIHRSLEILFFGYIAFIVYIINQPSTVSVIGRLCKRILRLR